MSFPRLPRLPVSRRRHDEVQKELERSRDRHGWSRALRKEAQDSQANCARKYQDLRTESEGLARQVVAAHNLADDYKRERDEARARVAELEQAIRAFVTSEDTHEPGPFVKDGNWHPGPCVEGGPRMEDVYPDGFQVCADEECFAYWPCDVERLRRVLDGHDRQEREHEPLETPVVSDELRQMYEERKRARGGRR